MPCRRMTGVVTLFFLGVLVFHILPAGAQVSESGRFSIMGRVVQEQGGQPVEMAQVELRTFTGMTITQTSTDMNGQFGFHGLSRGVYYVYVWKRGYGEQNERIEIVNFSYVGVHITLNPMPGAANRPVNAPPVSAEYLKIPEKARKEYEAGVKDFMQNGNLNLSLEHLRKAIEAHPQFSQAYYFIGLVQMDLNQLDESREAFTRAIELNEKIAPAYFPLGSLHMQRREYPQAEQILAKGLELSPNAWQGHYEHARACLAQAKLDCAEQSGVRARELHAEFAKVYLLLANVYLAQGKDEQAIAEAEKYVSKSDDLEMVAQVRRQIEELRRAVKPPQ